MKLITWNVRGMNKLFKKKEIKEFFRKNKINIVAIIEHRVQEQHANKIISKIAPGWERRTNYGSGGTQRKFNLWWKIQQHNTYMGKYVYSPQGQNSVSQLFIALKM